jgi:hypothetical protein
VFETTAVSFLVPIGNRRKGGQFVGLNKYMQQWPAFFSFFLLSSLIGCTAGEKKLPLM